MNIVLIGYRGSGKSTLGELLSRQLKWECFDIDRMIESHAHKSIAEAYTQLGEKAYRDLESQQVAAACSGDERIVATGGGSIMRQENQMLIMRNALVVYLKLSAEELWQRIERDPRSASTRPNLAGGGFQEVVQMLAWREPIYERCATLHVRASQSSEELLNQILEHLMRTNKGNL